MSDTNFKQQIIDKIKNNTNILVTVSDSPSVDELSAALGLTLLLNKMKKHATAVFSGQVPPVMSFLDPEKTFENTVDSLRDFIIALDKEKADHLRYKVEGDVVKIFITPYKTTITNEDLDFSQGDYNVELVLALGVRSQGNLDTALDAHGKIIDDATVVTIIAGEEKSELGSISWQDTGASSLSEMVVSLNDLIKNDKSMIDDQIATALLTGIVSATDRFSNSNTSAKVMSIASDLMKQGANQQLIASKFEEVVEDDSLDDIKSQSQEDSENADSGAKLSSDDNIANTTLNTDGTTDLSEGESSKLDRSTKSSEPNDDEGDPPGDSQVADDGSLSISHEKAGDLDSVAAQTAMENHGKAKEVAQAKIAEHTTLNTGNGSSHQALSDTLPPVVEPVDNDIINISDVKADPFEEPHQLLRGAVKTDAWRPSSVTSPQDYGKSLDVTSEQASASGLAGSLSPDSDKPILDHEGYIETGSEPVLGSPLNATLQAKEDMTVQNPLYAPPLQTSITDAAVGEEYAQPTRDSGTLMPAEDQSLPQGLPPLPDFSKLPPIPQGYELSSAGSRGTLGDLLPPIDDNAQMVASASDDPAQFRIPGQG